MALPGDDQDGKHVEMPACFLPLEEDVGEGLLPRSAVPLTPALSQGEREI